MIARTACGVPHLLSLTYREYALLYVGGCLVPQLVNSSVFCLEVFTGIGVVLRKTRWYSSSTFAPFVSTYNLYLEVYEHYIVLSHLLLFDVTDRVDHKSTA